jgi:hypothetical protein
MQSFVKQSHEKADINPCRNNDSDCEREEEIEVEIVHDLKYSAERNNLNG